MSEPDPFVDSLVHDSIIVQIPLLHGQINNRLEKVLSVFDQTNKEKDNRQLVELDDTNYADDADMQYILHRLIMASADAQLRQDMNVEDEYFQAIEDRDTAIMSRDKVIKEKDQQISQQNQQISQQNQQISQQSQQISQKDQQLNRVREKLRQQGLSETEIEEWLGIQKRKEKGKPPQHAGHPIRTMAKPHETYRQVPSHDRHTH